MKASFEKVATGASSFLVFERRDPSFPFHWHYHPEFELTLIVDSFGQRLVGDSIQEYGPGDLVLLGPNLPHSWRSFPNGFESSHHRAVVAQFREDCFGERFFHAPELHDVAIMLAKAARGLSFGSTVIGKRVASCFAELSAVSPARQLVTLLSVLVDLAGEKHSSTLSSGGPHPLPRLMASRRIDAICEYFETHYCQEVDFAALSTRLNIDQASLCRLFKRATGRTMTEYVNEIRVAAAAQLLVNTDESLIDICFQVGFGNYSHFSRQFKRLKGCNPQSLRRQFSADPLPSGASPINRSPTFQNLLESSASASRPKLGINSGYSYGKVATSNRVV
jgi:AraC-like DNA-binding protein